MPYEDLAPYMAGRFYMDRMSQPRQPSFWETLPALLSGIGQTFAGIRTQNEQARLQEAQREEKVFQALLQAPDPGIRAAALTGLMEGPQKKGGVFGKLFGTWEKSPKFAEIMDLLSRGGPIGSTAAPGVPPQLLGAAPQAQPTGAGTPPPQAPSQAAPRAPLAVAGSAAMPAGSQVTGTSVPVPGLTAQSVTNPAQGVPVGDRTQAARNQWLTPVEGADAGFGGPPTLRTPQLPTMDMLASQYKQARGAYPANEPFQLTPFNREQEAYLSGWDAFSKDALSKYTAATAGKDPQALAIQNLSDEVYFRGLAGDRTVLSDPALSRLFEARAMKEGLLPSPEQQIRMAETEESRAATLLQHVEDRTARTAMQEALLDLRREVAAGNAGARADSAALARLTAINGLANTVAGIEAKRAAELARLDDSDTQRQYLNEAERLGVSVPEAAVADRAARERRAIQAKYQALLDPLTSQFQTLVGRQQEPGPGTPPPDPNLAGPAPTLPKASDLIPPKAPTPVEPPVAPAPPASASGFSGGLGPAGKMPAPPAAPQVDYVPPQLKGKVATGFPGFEVLTQSKGNAGTLLQRINALLMQGSQPTQIYEEMRRQQLPPEMLVAAANYMRLKLGPQ